MRSIFTPCLGCSIERLNDLRFQERVHLCHDARRLALPREMVSRWIQVSKVLCRVNGDLQEPLEFTRLSQGRQLMENLVYIFSDRGITGQQPEVGIQFGVSRVVVAGSQVSITAQRPAFPSHDEYHFRVSFIADDAVDDMGAGLFQITGQLDIGFLVEPRAQLDDDGDLFSGFSACTRDLAMSESLPCGTTFA